MIASGPTVADRSTPADALAVLTKFSGTAGAIPDTVWAALKCAPPQRSTCRFPTRFATSSLATSPQPCRQPPPKRLSWVTPFAPWEATTRVLLGTSGAEFAELTRSARDDPSPASTPVCLLSGGEPTVRLFPTNQPRKGGRNQELVLAAVAALWNDGMDSIAILSGGTDGEDGPTDAAGAVADAELVRTAKHLGLDPAPFLAINNAYSFFEQTGGLIKTGPTHTNVIDLLATDHSKITIGLRKSNAAPIFSFVLRHLIIHSSFGFRHSSFPPNVSPGQAEQDECSADPRGCSHRLPPQQPDPDRVRDGFDQGKQCRLLSRHQTDGPRKIT